MIQPDGVDPGSIGHSKRSVTCWFPYPDIGIENPNGNGILCRLTGRSVETPGHGFILQAGYARPVIGFKFYGKDADRLKGSGFDPVVSLELHHSGCPDAGMLQSGIGRGPD